MGGFVHLELSTDNVKKAKSFYSKLFGWEMNDIAMPGGEYTMLALQNPGGAMQKKPMPEAPTMWLPYIAVDDVKKTVAAAEKSGGKAMAPYFEVEGFGEGAILMDPTGAAFGIWHGTSNGNGAQAAATSKKTGKKKAGKKAAAKKAPKKKAAKKKAGKKK
jgi:predicted enzyme related to lactoylglutathione lyase